jgi:hypothetical protein
MGFTGKLEAIYLVSLAMELYYLICKNGRLKKEKPNEWK